MRPALRERTINTRPTLSNLHSSAAHQHNDSDDDDDDSNDEHDDHIDDGNGDANTYTQKLRENRGTILWKLFLNKVQPLFFDVIPTKRRQGPQYGLLGLWGPGGIMFSSLANEASSPSQHILWLNHNFQEIYARFLYRLPKVDLKFAPSP